MSAKCSPSKNAECKECKKCGDTQVKKAGTCAGDQDTECEDKPFGKYVKKGNFYKPLDAKKGDMYRCRCVGGGKGISICNKGCGNPNMKCKQSKHGCAMNERKCNKNKCTCMPDSAKTKKNGKDMTFADCSSECKKMGMSLPSSADDVATAKNTGCNTNGARMWVN